MTHLASQISMDTATTQSKITLLTGSSDHSLFEKDFLTYCSTHGGQVGQDIRQGIATATPQIPPKPTIFDLRLHPKHGTPMIGHPKYEQISPTEAQAGDDTFDRDTLPLTPASEKRFQEDLIIWHREKDSSKTEFLKLKTDDDALLNVMLNHITAIPTETMKTNALIATFNQLPYTSVQRSFQYLLALKDQYAKGNSTTTVTEVSKFFSMSQKPEDTSAIFINKVNEQLTRILPLVEDPIHTGFISIKKVKSMVLIKGLNKSQGANLRALEIHMQLFPGTTSLDVPDELITSVLSMQDSDLANLTTNPDLESEQSAAFLSKPSILTPPKLPFVPGTKKANRTNHCAWCFSETLKKFGTGKYYYHAETDCRRKHGKPLNLAANSASIDSAALEAAFKTIRDAGIELVNEKED